MDWHHVEVACVAPVHDRLLHAWWHVWLAVQSTQVHYVRLGGTCTALRIVPQVEVRLLLVLTAVLGLVVEGSETAGEVARRCVHCESHSHGCTTLLTNLQGLLLICRRVVHEARVEHACIVVIEGDVDVQDDHRLVELYKRLRFKVRDALFCCL